MFYLQEGNRTCFIILQVHADPHERLKIFKKETFISFQTKTHKSVKKKKIGQKAKSWGNPFQDITRRYRGVVKLAGEGLL